MCMGRESKQSEGTESHLPGQLKHIQYPRAEKRLLCYHTIRSKSLVLWLLHVNLLQVWVLLTTLHKMSELALCQHSPVRGVVGAKASPVPYHLLQLGTPHQLKEMAGTPRPGAR